MTILNHSISIENFDAFVTCRSTHGVYRTTCNDLSYTFNPGVYVLQGEIDSGGWAISYALSTFYNRKKTDIISHPAPICTYNNQPLSLELLQKHSCYIDKAVDNKSDRIFRRSVHSIVARNIKKNHLNTTCEKVRELFDLTPERFERYIKYVGNEYVRSKAAIGYSDNKSIFCFPWFSKHYYLYLQHNIMCVCNILKALGKIVLLPTSYEFPEGTNFTIIKMR